MKMEVAEGDTCEEMVVNGIIGGHSTFEIRVLRHLGCHRNATVALIPLDAAEMEDFKPNPWLMGINPKRT
ncbi:hypothetical protein Q3G72_008983 [Acer saccharum]|nr:hypothetical protein Q3G72_008983 [Acer saccharum]